MRDSRAGLRCAEALRAVLERRPGLELCVGERRVDLEARLQQRPLLQRLDFVGVQRRAIDQETSEVRGSSERAAIRLEPLAPLPSKSAGHEEQRLASSPVT